MVDNEVVILDSKSKFPIEKLANYDDYDDGEDDDIQDLNDKEGKSTTMTVLSSCFIFVVLLSLLILLFYPDSRPTELKSVFEPFDEYLSVQQSFVNNFVADLKKFIENKEGKEKKKEAERKRKSANQQVMIELIKLRLDYENRMKSKTKSEPKGKDEVKFWKSSIKSVENGIKNARIKRENLEKELEKMQESRKELLSELSNINTEIKTKAKTMKEKDFIGNFMNVDDISKQIYNLLFKCAIMKSFIDDLDDRKGKILKIISHVRGGEKGKALVNNFNERYFYNWLWNQREDKEFIREIRLKSMNSLENKVKTVNTTDLTKIFEGLAIGKQESIAIDLSKVIRTDSSGESVNELVLKEYQEFERELFISLSKDLNYNRKIVDILNLIENTRNFINEFDVLKLKGDTIKFDHFDILLKRLERRTQAQEQRIKANEKMSLGVSVCDHAAFVEFWHKRNLLDLFTDRRLLNIDEMRYNEIKTVYEYSEKFNIWFKEKLLLLPPEKPVVDIKKRIEEISKQNSNNKNLSIDKIEDWPEYYRIMSKKLSIFDHSPYEFNLDRVMRDYSKFTGVNNQDSLLYFNSGFIFVAAAFYGNLMRKDEWTLNRIRDDWPRTSSDDKSVLEDEERYKKLFVRTVNEKKQYVPIVQSFWDLASVADKPQNQKNLNVDKPQNQKEKADNAKPEERRQTLKEVGVGHVKSLTNSIISFLKR